MKCPKCNGKGYVYNVLGSFNEDCGHCQGTGTVRVEGEPMTNEEWLRSCTTEQLAEFIRQQRDGWSDGWYSDCHRFEEIVEWLKQPHKEN